jgi:hypothetical protein
MTASQFTIATQDLRDLCRRVRHEQTAGRLTQQNVFGQRREQQAGARARETGGGIGMPRIKLSGGDIYAMRRLQAKANRNTPMADNLDSEKSFADLDSGDVYAKRRRQQGEAR